MLSFSEVTEYEDQIVIVDGIGVTHFIPRRARAKKGGREKKDGGGKRAGTRARQA